jgi:hypothetical protein
MLTLYIPAFSTGILVVTGLQWYLGYSRYGYGKDDSEET